MLLDLASHKSEKPAGKIRKQNEKNIIAAAECEFALHGYAGATMNKIAQRADIPKSNVHYYFKNKLQLYAEVLSSILDLWDGALNELNADEDPAICLRNYISTKMAFSRQYPYASCVFAKEILSGAPRLTDYFESGYQQWFESKTRVFDAWAKKGKIAPLEPAHIIFLIWSSTQHYADFSVQIAAAMGKNQLVKKDYEEATQALTTIILRGIGVKNI